MTVTVALVASDAVVALELDALTALHQASKSAPSITKHQIQSLLKRTPCAKWLEPINISTLAWDLCIYMHRAKVNLMLKWIL